ncbi:MAG: hypothetical protein K2J00_07640, partial [Bacteroidaceae bacterium]|nr:hypothetical protein [Bacteroidaceae bacterium]
MPLSLELSYLYLDWYCHDGKPSRYAALLHFLNLWMWDGKDEVYFPERQAEAFVQMAEHEDREIRAIALSGTVLMAIRHGDRLPASMANAFLQWAENGTLQEEIIETQKYLLTSVTGLKMQKRLHDEVLDKMQKEQQTIREKLGMEDDEDVRMEIAEEGNKRMMSYVQKLHAMVQDGIDMNLGTFASLRGLDFFKELKNWLLDFDINHPQLIGLGDKKPIANALFGHGDLCDLDKYA